VRLVLVLPPRVWEHILYESGARARVESGEEARGLVGEAVKHSTVVVANATRFGSHFSGYLTLHRTVFRTASVTR